MALKIIDEAKRLVEGEIDPARVCRGMSMDYAATVQAFKQSDIVPVWRDWSPFNATGRLRQWHADIEQQQIQCLIYISQCAPEVWEDIRAGRFVGIDLALSDVTHVKTKQGMFMTNFHICAIGLLRPGDVCDERRASSDGAGE